MKLIAETHDALYLLQVKGSDGEVLATAAAETGGNPHAPSRFFIWEEDGPDDDGNSEEYEGQTAVQTHQVQDRDRNAVWEQVVEFETYRVAMDVWGRKRDQEAREVRFLKYVVECQETFLPNLDRLLSIHFDLQGEDIDAAVLRQMELIHGFLKQAYQTADLLYDPPKD